MNESSIICHQVTCRYGAVVALNEVSFQIDRGTWVYLLGPSASGKTTLLRAIAGLEPLARGKIHLHGQLTDTTKRAFPPHGRKIGFLFQEQTLWPHLSAAANVELGVPDDQNKRDRRKYAMQWLERLGIEALARRFPAQLSGGEARRVALARALASRPRILFLDEPTANLDLHLRGEMIALLHQLHQELNVTTLCVTHQLDPPLNWDDKTLILEKGSLIYDGPLGKLASVTPTPYIQALKDSILTSL